MALPELTKKIVETSLTAMFDKRLPTHVRDKLRLEVEFEGNTVTLIETRPYFRDPNQWTRSPVARLRYNQTDNLWSLFCRDRHGKWHAYDNVEPTADFASLVAEIDQDPTGIFWG